MPSKEIKELRQAGKLEEAYAMAKTELDADKENIWGKRNMSWVLYTQLDVIADNPNHFLEKLKEVKDLNLPENEEMFFDNISIVIAKAARNISYQQPIDTSTLYTLFKAIKDLPIIRSSKWFSVLYKAFHKGLKDTIHFIEFADWWDFSNIKQEDFEKEAKPNGKQMMSIAEQAYIAYAKQLLPIHNQYGETTFDKEKAIEFLPKLTEIVDKHPDLQYPAYFHAKLLLALGDKKDGLTLLLPFAKRKKNDFWVWDLLAEVFEEEPEKEFACYCRALCCHSPEEMLVKVRQKFAKLLIDKQLYVEAKTEIELLMKARTEHAFKIPNEVVEWTNLEWFKNAHSNKSNSAFYKQYAPIADELLFTDIPEELIFVEFVNTDKKILNFIVSDMKHGFTKYERFFNDIKIGDTVRVRFQGGAVGGAYQLLTATKVNNEEFKKQFYKEVEGEVRIKQGNTFGFIGDAFIHPSIVAKQKLSDGMKIKGIALKSYNPEKKQLSWKLIKSI